MHQSSTVVTEKIVPRGLLIDGVQVPASDSATQDVHAPATGEVLTTIARATAEDVDRAVTIVQRGQTDWAARTAYEREKIIRSATAHVRTRAAEIGKLMALEQGKPLNQSVGEVEGSCDTIDYFAAEGVRIEGYTNPTEKSGLRSWVIYHPVGVCALITPWNYPLSLLSWKLGPAFAAGCAAVVKPPSATPLSPLAFCEALVEGGLPAELLAVVTGTGATAGEALVRHPGVDKVAMTGSSKTGKRLMEIYAPSLKKISLELGGHCPAVVCADADVELAAKTIAYKGFRNMGQSCSSVNRVYVHRSLYGAFVAKLTEEAEALTIGDGVTDGTVDLGPMTTADGLATVKAHVADAVAKGAKVLYGGTVPEGESYVNGQYYLPTILTDVSEDMLVMNEETFGPVVPVQPYDDDDQAVSMANDTTYGLVSYLFAKDFSRIIRISEMLEAGTVCVNNGSVNTNYGPYAGWKESGYGLELSRKAIFEYLNTKHIKVQIG